jgi:NDP-sugar pyrophosphorylase family protein
MNILIPIAGTNPFFPPEEYAYPRPLIQVGSRSMIDWVIDNLKSVASDAHFFFVVPEEEARNFSYENVFNLLTGGRCETIILKRPTGGALCSCLCAIDRIPPDEPLVIANSDQIINADLSKIIKYFEAKDADGGVISFESVHPRWSYVSVEPDSQVTYAAEKRVISNQAIAGFYYFRRADTFFKAAEEAIANNAELNGKYYISASLNEAVLAGKKIYAANISNDRYHSFYHPKQIESFERSSQAFIERIEDARKPVQVIVPAAGEGSRFAKAGFATPKPFIDVDGRPMVERVMANLGVRNAVFTLIFRKDHIEANGGAIAQLRRSGVHIVEIDQPTEGTACTVLRARELFDNDSPLLIANSDQIVDFDINAMVDDCLERNLDGSILVFRDAEKNPKWSFAKLGPDGLVEQVAEKLAISDLATVGVYFFRRGSDFVRAAIDMIAMNERVNNEFYTCPVYNHAIRKGLKFGVFEISREAMHGIGTPEDLARYLELARANSVVTVENRDLQAFERYLAESPGELHH